MKPGFEKNLNARLGGVQCQKSFSDFSQNSCKEFTKFYRIIQEKFLTTMETVFCDSLRGLNFGLMGVKHFLAYMPFCRHNDIDL